MIDDAEEGLLYEQLDAAAEQAFRAHGVDSVLLLTWGELGFTFRRKTRPDVTAQDRIRVAHATLFTVAFELHVARLNGGGSLRVMLAYWLTRLAVRLTAGGAP